MSARQWEDYFGALGYPTSGPGYYTDGYVAGATPADPPAKYPCAASDQVAYLLHRLLAADDLLVSIFGVAGIGRYGMRPLSDQLHLPRLYVYPGSVQQEGVSEIAFKLCDVVAELVFGTSGVRPTSERGATIASALAHLERIAAQNDQLTATVADGDQRVIADSMTIQSYQTAVDLDEKDRPFAFSQSIQFQCRVQVERRYDDPFKVERIFNLTHPLI